MPSEICPKCQKAVYAAERKIAGGKAWHSMCLKCGLCNKMLDSTTVAEHEGEVYCKTCHGRKFGPKGYGFGGGSGALNMDTGTHVGNKETEMSNKPTAAGMGGKVISPEEGGCPRCGKRVYDAEKANWMSKWTPIFIKHVSDAKFVGNHLIQLRCAHKKKKKKFTVKLVMEKTLGPKGFGFGQGAGALNMG
uniref:SJCHGC02224 protein n=1 Tax=Schistosoma japonicum TaxID=6182 RepID=Q5D907_SCHJA|nr:SJCHGC02224 protein [Schistosoma japonicum]